MDLESASDGEEIRIPDWAEHVKPLYQPRKWALRLHYVASFVLLIGGVALLAISIDLVRRFAKSFELLADEYENPDYHDQPSSEYYTAVLRIVSHLVVAAVSAGLGLGTMCLSWVSCTAAGRGACSHLCKLLLLTIHLLTIATLAYTSVSLRHLALSLSTFESRHLGASLDAMFWAQLVAERPDLACSAQLSMQCAGWETGDCAGCYVVGGGGGGEAQCDAAVCPRECGGVSGEWGGCKVPAVEGAVGDAVGPVAGMGFALVGVLVVDLVLVVLLLPCCGRNEEGFFMVQAKRGRALPRYRDR